MKHESIATMTHAVVTVIEGMPDGQEFYGSELHDAVCSIYPEAHRMYPDTLLRMMRRRCRDLVEVVDHNRSLYRKVGYQRTA